MRLPTDRPAAFVIVQQGNLGRDGGPGEQVRCFGEVGGEGLDLAIEGTRTTRLVDQRAVELFLPAEGRAPLPVKHRFGPVRHRLPGHCARFAFVQGVVGIVPVDIAGLGFHQPPAAALQAARQVVVCVGVGVVVVALADVPVP